MSLELGRVGLGTGPIGGLYEAVDEDVAVATVARALDRGLRLVDTAPLYGHGLAERRVGRALAGRPRDSFVVSTKVGRLLRPAADADDGMWAEPGGLEAAFDFSADGVRRSLEESLERLGLDRVDVLLVHDPDAQLDTALAGALPAAARLRDEGVVSAVGVGSNRVAPLLRVAREADVDVLLVAGRYTLLDRTALPELLPACVERGIRVLAGGVLNSGLLAGGATFDYRPAPLEVVARARALAEVCARHGVPLAAAALRFPLAHAAVAAVLVGARSPAELDEDLDLLAAPIPRELWAELRAEGLVPGEVPLPDDVTT